MVSLTTRCQKPLLENVSVAAWRRGSNRACVWGGGGVGGGTRRCGHYEHGVPPPVAAGFSRSLPYFSSKLEGSLQVSLSTLRTLNRPQSIIYKCFRFVCMCRRAHATLYKLFLSLTRSLTSFGFGNQLGWGQEGIGFTNIL